MRLFSDLRIFERPPKSGVALFRWIAWRWIFLSIFFLLFTATFAYFHYVGGEPIYYTNEDRNLTPAEVRDLLQMFFSAGGLFFVLGLLGVLVIPRS